ncbi:MAG: hypothetical protein CMB31_04975 [Euryarchaeota archaeon]|nr:hypothetical protein [Euryarchaeota archaeon]
MSVNRVISIGDIHGDFTIFKRLLYMCKVIDKSGNWVGGSTHVIQMGDTVDGKRPGIKMDKKYIQESGELEIILYILILDSQAKLKGGRVISILGNHELYSHYFRDDTKEYTRDYIKKVDIDVFKYHGLDREKFLLPGKEGGKLFGRTRPMIVQIGEFLFIHGSITDAMIRNNLDNNGMVDINKINSEVSSWLMGKTKVPKYLENMDENNPIFSREYSDKKNISDFKCNKIAKQLMKFYNAKYVVMGHSSYASINSTCKKMLIRTDVSLSRAFGGNLDSKKLQALEIIQSRDQNPIINIITFDGKTPLK